MRIVLDTNIFISGIHWNGASSKILRAWFTRDFQLISSPPIIEEVTRILSNFKVSLPPEDITWWEDLIIEKSIIVVPRKTLQVVKADPDDDKFFEAAVEGKAKYIVSQDKHLLKIGEYKGIKVLNPKQFLEILS